MELRPKLEVEVLLPDEQALVDQYIKPWSASPQEDHSETVVISDDESD